VMLDANEKPHIIRKKETLSSIQNEEVMPAYLQKFKL
jgi:hypothetical protein